MTQILGVILAGGQARRMGGGDKALLPLKGQSLLTYVIDRLGPQVGDIALNANGDPKRFADYNLPVIADSVEGFAGPLAGILAGLDWAAKQGAQQIITAAADTPFFPPDLAEHLKSANAPLVLAASIDPKRGLLRQPTFGLWPVDLREDLRTALLSGTRKVVDWTDRHGAKTVGFSIAGFDPFFNVNTPEDMVKAEELLERVTT